MKNIYGNEIIRTKFSGKMLRTWREKANKTQKELANLLEIDYQQYQRWEYGDSCPSADNLMLISNVLDISIQDLYDLI